VARQHPRAAERIERALILAEGELISAGQLGIVPRASGDVATPATPIPDIERRTEVLAVAEVEKQMIVEALRRANGNKSRAAAALGLSRTQLLRRVRRFGLEPRRPHPPTVSRRKESEMSRSDATSCHCPMRPSTSFREPRS
jgi:DNA-binding NtrC family response regulator